MENLKQCLTYYKLTGKPQKLDIFSIIFVHSLLMQK